MALGLVRQSLRKPLKMRSSGLVGAFKSSVAGLVQLADQRGSLIWVQRDISALYEQGELIWQDVK